MVGLYRQVLSLVYTVFISDPPSSFHRQNSAPRSCPPLARLCSRALNTAWYVAVLSPLFPNCGVTRATLTPQLLQNRSSGLHKQSVDSQ